MESFRKRGRDRGRHEIRARGKAFINVFSLCLFHFQPCLRSGPCVRARCALCNIQEPCRRAVPRVGCILRWHVIDKLLLLNIKVRLVKTRGFSDVNCFMKSFKYEIRN